MNSCESEIDEIRLKLYDETKDLTIEEHTQRSNELTLKTAAKYGFKIGQPIDKSRISVS